MKKINNQGFTLIEMLAVVIILGILTSITVPTVTSLIQKSQKDNEKNQLKTIISATKMYITDNKYEIELEENACDANNERNIKKIEKYELTDSKLPIKVLIDEGYIKGKIKDQTTKQELNTDPTQSYIVVKYNCESKDYNYAIPILNWKQ